MEHMYVDLGHLPRGTVVELHIAGNAANVWLMDSSTYSGYKRGNSVRAIGGHTRQTPVRLQTDHSGHWYAAADLGGYPGRLGLQARVLPGPAAPLRQRPNLAVDSPLVTFADELPEEAFEDREFDVFISHATEDKDQVVRQLAHALKARGIDAWYDEFELRVGDSLRRKIDTPRVTRKVVATRRLRKRVDLGLRPVGAPALQVMPMHHVVVRWIAWRWAIGPGQERLSPAGRPSPTPAHGRGAVPVVVPSPAHITEPV
jgi:hypothetical protein